MSAASGRSVSAEAGWEWATATVRVCGSSKAKDRVQAIAATDATAVAMLDPAPTAPQWELPGSSRFNAVYFLVPSAFGYKWIL